MTSDLNHASLFHRHSTFTGQSKLTPVLDASTLPRSLAKCRHILLQYFLLPEDTVGIGKN